MSFSGVVGSAGVALLLAAFLLNLLGTVASDSPIYQAMNALGAGISCYASYLIGFAPFVVLEATWCAVAIVALISRARHQPELSG
ncbi:MAG TPA: hypothetical protein VFP82_03980 [Chthoniobacterales bacterium]|nr:hypothetical protein [Chthoniobacterales bacterium]